MAEEKQKKKRGDRRDGTRAKTDGMHDLMGNLYKNRTDAEVFMHVDLDVTEVLRFVQKKNEEDPTLKTKPWHVFVMAVAKTVKVRPYLNRFIVGRKTYERKDISLSFMVKREFADGAGEEMLCTKIRDEMALDDVSRIILGDAKKLRAQSEPGAVEKIISGYGKLPRFLQRFIVWLAMWLDFHDFLPMELVENNIHHTSVLMSNLGSIRCDAPYHHLNNFGTNGIVITIGTIKKRPVYSDDGSVEMRDTVDAGITLDERIADGFYFARSVEVLKYILAHPEELDKPLGEELPYEPRY